jgi:hypothetical protein
MVGDNSNNNKNNSIKIRGILASTKEHQQNGKTHRYKVKIVGKTQTSKM